MLRLSLNLLSNILYLLRSEQKSQSSSFQEKQVFYKAYSVSVESMISLAEKCKWVTRNEGIVTITEKGLEILKKPGDRLTEEKLRLMLFDYIVSVKPIWRSRIPFGRREATIFMSKDEMACFSEGGLLNPNPNSDVIAWWDKLSSMIKKERDDEKLVTGRKGELLTIEYEKRRTGKIPQWRSIDSNLIGYDILSIEKENSSNNLFIEVKTSYEPIEMAFFYISKNEWQVASKSKSYLFYVWQISAYKTRLAIISPNTIESHMPINQNDGEWESVKIPFNSFSEQFMNVTLQGDAL